MAVRSFDNVDDTILLGSNGAALTSYSVLVGFKPTAIPGADRPVIGLGTGTTTGIANIYVKTGTGAPAFGSGVGDSIGTGITCSATGWQLLMVTKAAGTTAPRFHWKNLTTGAAVVRVNGATSIADQSGNWTSTYINRFTDIALFLGQRVFVAAFIDTVLADADFDTIVAAASTASILSFATSPDRVWDFNQDPIADVFDLESGADDETSRVGTTVITGDDPPGWTFGAAVPQIILPDADIATTGWTTTPLFSKVNDSSDATIITGTLA